MSHPEFHVLVLDEASEATSSLRETLRSLKVSVTWTHSYDEVLVSLKAHSYGLVILDVNLASHSINDIAARFQEEQGSETPLLFLVPVSRKGESLFSEIPEGMIDCLQKPVDPSILASKVSVYQAWYRSQQRLQVEIERRQSAEKQLVQLAQYDQLTGLANRNQFLTYLTGAIARASRRNANLAVVFLDLDHFKNVNDRFGHGAGDLLLQRVASRLSDSVRTGDMIARFGGDEFALVLDDIPHPEDAARVAQKIIENLAQPYIILNQEIFASPSIGIATYPECGGDAESLVKSADSALYLAKSRGRNNYQFFSEEMHQQSMQRMQLEADLRHAIEHKELMVYYQPKIDAQTGVIKGMEALIRWEHEKLGIIGPEQFVPVAEDAGLINMLGQWILEESCWQNQKWIQQNETPVSVSVNVSMRQLQQPHFVATLQSILEKSQLAPKHLEIELTESTLMENPEEAIGILNQIHDLGISIAIDDFGTGYSSLNYLKRLPLDVLKIDQTFVREIEKDDNDKAIVKAILSMAGSLGLSVVAEGVESKAQLDFLKDNHCDTMQGYYFSRPLPQKEASKLLVNGLKVS